MPNEVSDPQEDFDEKLRALTQIAATRNIQILVLRRQGSLAWLFGARSHVPYTLDRSWFDAIVDFSGHQPQVTIMTNKIEAQRLQETELADFSVEWSVLDWWQDRAASLPKGTEVGSDLPVGYMVDISQDIASMKRTLTKSQVSKLEQVCRDSALIGTSVAGQIHPTMTETHVAGIISAAMLDRELDPVTILVSGGDRIRNHRHPLPTRKPIGDRATVVFCGRRSGLISAVTRIVSFRPLRQSEKDTYQRLLEVEGEFLDATCIGVPIGQAFSSGVAGYARNGFSTVEWHRHHQGGFTGWESREYPACSDSSDLLVDGSVVAWNPSAEGLKVEDTTLVSSSGPRTLVHDPFWPTVEVRGRQRPQIVEL